MSDKLREPIVPPRDRKMEAPVSRAKLPHTRAVLSGASYGGLVEVFDAFHLPRTTAFKYAKAGLVETFLIGRKRMVMVKSVETLPERLRSTEERANEG